MGIQMESGLLTLELTLPTMVAAHLIHAHHLVFLDSECQRIELESQLLDGIQQDSDSGLGLSQHLVFRVVIKLVIVFLLR